MKNRNGFTLIELLAVIVILGLLMAIAIPSITRYITESRKNTMTTTINNYIGSITNEVNDMGYTFTQENTVYAVPIECIAVERGGRNPFGEWHQANDSYWAYVLIQYDADNSSYRYGFTYKDSAGYGLYPISQSKFKELDKYIKTGLSLTRPTTGKITSLTALENWLNSGLIVDETTKLNVLISESEGKLGDGKKTCTLAQKGSNYADVELEKEKLQEERAKKYTLKATSFNNKSDFWKYRYDIKTVTFQDYINIPSDISDDHKWDVSLTGTQTVMAYIKENANDPAYYDLYIQGDGELYANPNSSYLFTEFISLEEIKNAEIFNTKYVTNMSQMFAFVGEETERFVVDLTKWDTSKVTNMSNMFDYTAPNATIFKIGNISNWDTSKVTNMSYMFYSVGFSVEEFNLDLSKWNTSKVTNMSLMFCEVGYSSKTVNINLTGWDTSNVTDMNKMFVNTGYYSKTFNLIGLSNWNTSNVTNMSYMFSSLGKTSEVIDLSKWNVDKVTSWISFTNSAKATFKLPAKFA